MAQTEKPTRPPSFLSLKEFIDSYKAPNYVVRDFLQQGFLYSLTAPTGVGKTSVALRIAMHVAAKRDFGNCEIITPGHVLFLAGENPTDITQRVAALMRQMALEPEKLPFTVISGTYKLKEHMERVKAWAEALPEGVKLVVVDTAIAYFTGTDENDNVEMAEYAKVLRSFTELKGHPAVLVCCHPIKRGQPTMPRGGGALLNEVDGNLIASGKRGDPVRLHWADKYRGPNFEPKMFEMLPCEGPLTDDKGKPMPTVIAIPEEAGDMKKRLKQMQDATKQLAAILPVFPGATYIKLAKELQWFTGLDNKPYVAKIKRTMRQLEEWGKVELDGEKWRWVGAEGPSVSYGPGPGPDEDC